MFNISIVIPTCNRPRKLQRAIQSVHIQNIPSNTHMEVIIVNDGEPDSLVIPKIKYPVKVVETGGYVGPSLARNKGVHESDCAWISFLDDDDQFIQGKINNIVHLFRECDVICHGACINLLKEKIKYYTLPEKQDNWFRSLLIRNTLGGTPMVAVRRELFNSVGGFCNDMGALEDYELWLRLSEAGARIRTVQLALTECEYVTQSHSVSKNIDTHIEAIKYIHQEFYDYYGDLTSAELRLHREWIHSMFGYKYLLNGERISSFKEYIKAFAAKYSYKYLIMSGLVLIWPNSLLYLRRLTQP